MPRRGRSSGRDFKCYKLSSPDSYFVNWNGWRGKMREFSKHVSVIVNDGGDLGRWRCKVQHEIIRGELRSIGVKEGLGEKCRAFVARRAEGARGGPIGLQ